MVSGLGTDGRCDFSGLELPVRLWRMVLLTLLI